MIWIFIGHTSNFSIKFDLLQEKKLQKVQYHKLMLEVSWFEQKPVKKKKYFTKVIGYWVTKIKNKTYTGKLYIVTTWKSQTPKKTVAVLKDIEKNVRGRLAMENSEFELSSDKYVCVWHISLPQRVIFQEYDFQSY